MLVAWCLLRQVLVLCFVDVLVNVLWNLHTYYKQFSPIMTEQISRQKAPIEKELKVRMNFSRHCICYLFLNR